MPPRVLTELPSDDMEQIVVAHRIALAVHHALGPREERGRAAARIYIAMPPDVKFKMLDLDGNFMQMIHMLDHSVAQRKFLLNHIKMSGQLFGEWAIERRPQFEQHLEALRMTEEEVHFVRVVGADIEERLSRAASNP